MRIRFFSCYLRILLILICVGLPEVVDGNELFSKMKIQPMKEEKAPNFSLPGLDGGKVELKKMRGKVVILNFWATWCGPCKEEMPSMEVLHQRFKERGLILLAISVDYETEKVVKEFIKKYRYTFPVLLDPKCSTLDLYKVKGIPTTFLIDKKGRLVGKAIGPRDWMNPEIISFLNMLIEK